MSWLRGMSFLFCDLVASTELMMRLGEELDRELRRDVFAALRRPIVPCRGAEVKSQGDGIMVAFEVSVDDALRCAIAMQDGIARLAESGRFPLALRVGVSFGPASFEGGDWYGPTVVEAARLCALAAPGQILVTDRAVEAARCDVRFDSLGEWELKGFPRPVACSALSWKSSVTRGPPLPEPPELALAFEPRFVGNTVALTQAVDRWRDAVSGQSGVLLVTGPPHAGRSRLVSELAARAAGDGGAVLYSSGCRDASPYQAVTDGLRRLALASAALVDQLRTIEGLSTFVPVFAAGSHGNGVT